MKKDICPKFGDWLERLPRTELSPDMQRHIESCEFCRTEIAKLEPAALSLNSAAAPQPLDKQTLNNLTEMAENEFTRLKTRKLTLRLTLAGLLCLPLLILINWFWASVGFNLLADYISPTLGYLYLVFFSIATLTITGLTYGAIPLLAGVINENEKNRSHNSLNYERI